MASITSRFQDEGQSPSSVREARVAVAEGPVLAQVPLVDEEDAREPPELLPPSTGSQQSAISTQSYLAGRGFKQATVSKAQRKHRFFTDYLPWLVAIISAMIFVALGVIVFVLPSFNTTTTTTTTATTATTTTYTTATTTTHTTTGSTTTSAIIRTSTKPAAKTMQGGNLRSASTTSAPPSSVDDLNAAVLVSMTVQQVDYEKLRSLGDVQTSFQREVAAAIADQAGGIDEDAIEVKLAPGSVRVDAHVPDLTGAEAMSLESEIIASTTTLTARLKSSIENVAGIDEALTGSVAVTNLQVNAVAKTASSAGSSRAQAAAWLFGIAAACCCPLLGLLIWQHGAWGAMGKGYMPAPLSSTSRDDTSESKPLVTPPVTGRQGAGKPKAKVRKKTEKTQETEKTGKTEKTENTQTTQLNADQKDQQPSQQPAEKKKRLVRVKRKAKPDESAREGETASAQQGSKPKDEG